VESASAPPQPGEELLPGARAGRSLSFDRVADVYDATRGGAERAARHAALVAPHLDRGQPVLEIGVGTGAVATALVDRGFACRGVDISRAMIRHAHDRLGPVVMVADASRLPLRDASVPEALSVWVLHLVGDLDAVVGDVARVLKPGGRWVIIPAGGAAPGEPDLVDGLVLPLEAKLYGVARVGPRPSEQRLRAAAAAAGLLVESVDPAPPAMYEESPADRAANLEQRTYSMCWHLDDAGYERDVAPVVAALRALPDASRPLLRSTPVEIIVVLRRPER
jgi:SAM-dependent methyltransferase